MKIFNSHPINQVWKNICKYEGADFFTIRGKKYQYTVIEDYILINDDPSRGRITKTALEKALLIENPTPSKIGGWAPSYLYGIITDERIKAK